MILAIILLSALPQGEAEQPPPEMANRGDWSEAQQIRAQEWWQGLSDEQRVKYIKRQDKWGKMDDQRRQKMKERRDIFEGHEKESLALMSGDELEEFGKMNEHRKRKHLRDLARARMQKSDNRPPRRLPSHDISLREPQIREALRQAHASGWLGDKAVIWLEAASVDEAIQVLFSIRKWQFLEKANTEGFWKANNISDRNKSKLVAMPAEHFLREIRRIMSDEHKIWDGNSENRRNKGRQQSSEKR